MQASIVISLASTGHSQTSIWGLFNIAASTYKLMNFWHMNMSQQDARVKWLYLGQLLGSHVNICVERI